MKQWINNISTYFLRHDWWIFGAIILFVSYVWMQQSTILGWQTYGSLIASLSIAYALPLGFAIARDSLVSKHLSKGYYWWWILCFLVPPMVFAFWRISVNELPFLSSLLSPEDNANKWGVPFLGVLLILADAFLWLANRKQNDRTKAHWITRLSVPMLAVVVVSSFALFVVISNNFVTDKAAEYKGVSCLWFYLLLWMEVTVIYLSYYLIYYLHYHFLYRRLLQQKGFFHYLMGAVVMLLLLSPIYSQLIVWLPLVKSMKIHTVGLVPNVFADINYIIPIGIFILSLPFIMIQEWYQRQNTISELEREKTTTELDLLKQQINPHFFFNTLNNLYAMSLTQDEETPETILKLSELMRYVIYQGQQEQVPLQAEIKYLQDYLDLQQIRLHQQSEIRFHVDNEQDNLMIAPLLLIILLENAFKHGIEPAESTSFLAVELKTSDRLLTFICRNSKVEPSTENKASGIGLQNLSRRLELLYPDRYDLKLDSTDKEYNAILKLKL